MYRYVDSNGKTQSVYSWWLAGTDPVSAGKKDDGALRDKERLIQKDLDDNIQPKGTGLTVLNLIKKYIGQKTGTLVYLDSTKTYAGIRVIPMSDDVYECFDRILENRNPPKVEPMIDWYRGFLWFAKDKKSMVAMYWEKYFQHAVENTIVSTVCSYRRLHLMFAVTLIVLIWLSLV